MDPSLVALEREIEDLKTKRSPVAAKLNELDEKIERKERARDMLLGKTPVDKSKISPAKPTKDVEVAIGELLEKHGAMERTEIIAKLVKGETGDKYTQKSVNQSISVLIKPDSDKLTQKITFEKGKIKSEVIGFGPNWPKKG